MKPNSRFSASDAGDINPSDRHALNAMDGWIELGNLKEAANELNNLSEEKRNDGRIWRMRMMLSYFHKPRDWRGVREAAEQITKIQSDNVYGWLVLANATRFSRGGGVQAAYDVLRPVHDRFPHEWMVSYHLAAYATQLGQLDVAYQWKEKALEAAGDNAHNIGARMLFDRDFAPLIEALRDLRGNRKLAALVKPDRKKRKEERRKKLAMRRAAAKKEKAKAKKSRKTSTKRRARRNASVERQVKNPRRP